MKRIKGNNIKKIFYDEDNNSIIKTFNNKIARVEAKFWNEVTCLQLLHKNFVNKYNIHYPFPKLIHYNTDELSITTSYCGIQARLNTSIKPKQLKYTITCIIDNLKRNFLIYKDIHPNNVCIDTRGYIYLIDFDAGFLLNYEDYIPITSSQRYKRCNSHNYKKEYFDNYYKKPNNIREYRNYDINTLSDWKSKPWSMLYMFKGIK